MELIRTYTRTPVSSAHPRHKTCQTCKTYQPLAAFPRHRGSRDGHRVHCRDCLLSGRYQPKPETPAQSARRKVRQSTPKSRRSHAAALQRWAEREPLQVLAKKEVNKAVLTRRLIKSQRCQAEGCSSTKNIEAHHHSYQPEHWFDVLWCCAPCHRRGHARGNIVPAADIPRHYGQIPGLAFTREERAPCAPH